MDLHAVHDRVLVDVKDGPLATSVEEDPAPR